jgi:hypothetical protein
VRALAVLLVANLKLGDTLLVLGNYPSRPNPRPRPSPTVLASCFSACRRGYPSVHRRLMDERRRLDEPLLREAVQQSGGNGAQIQHDLRFHAAEIEQQLNLNRGNAFALGIAMTPAYLAGPILVSGAIDEAGFARAFAIGRNTAMQ